MTNEILPRPAARTGREGRPSRRALPLLVLAVAGLAGCGDFLEKSPLSAIGSDQFYQTEQQAVAATNAVYDVLTPMHQLAGMLQLGDIAANTIEVEGHDNMGPYDGHFVEAGDNALLNFWNLTYNGINRANAVIDRLPAAQFSPAVRDRLIGEARYLRALYLFRAVQLWGPIPLPITESTSLEGLDLPRSSEAEVYAQIVSDLGAAEAVLPVTAPQAGRATRGAAKALLAKVHLTHGQFAEARDKAREVMNLGVYALWDSYADAFKLANENGKEAIFSVQYETGVSEGSNIPGWGLPDELKGIVPGGGGVTRFYWRADTTLIRAYEPGDTRRALNVVTSYTYQGKTYTWETPLNFKYHDGMHGFNILDSPNNWPITRYAEVLLIFAEAENEVAGPTAAAYDALNRVRRRAFGLPLSAPSVRDYAGLSQQQFREAVWMERFREFSLEGHQWFDLKRTDRLVETMGMPPHRVVYPIPTRELLVNKSLEQNPGY